MLLRKPFDQDKLYDGYKFNQEEDLHLLDMMSEQGSRGSKVSFANIINKQPKKRSTMRLNYNYLQ